MLGCSLASAPEVGGFKRALRKIILQAGGQSVMSVLCKLNTPTFPIGLWLPSCRWNSGA